MLPLRTRLENTQVALILVVVVVGVAALGNRPAGYLAAASAALWFNFFFTQPYQRFVISEQSDVTTFVLLMLVGVAVTELATWGRRQHAKAVREAGFLAGIEAAAATGAGGGSPQALIRQVAEQLVTTLELQSCRYQPGVAGLGNPPRLRRDGTVTWNGASWDADRRGLPDGTETELLVESGGRLLGRFLLTPTPGRPVSLDRRRVALTLVDQIGVADRAVDA